VNWFVVLLLAVVSVLPVGQTQVVYAAEPRGGTGVSPVPGAGAGKMPVPPATKAVLSAGELRLTLERSGGGIGVVSLADAAKGVELLAAKPLPLFSLVLRHVPSSPGGTGVSPVSGASTGKMPVPPVEVRLDAAAGWQQQEIIATGPDKGVELRWKQPKDQRLKDIQVTAQVAADSKAAAFRWKLEVQNKSPDWTVWRVVFPQIAVADLGAQASVFLPRGPGEVQRALWQRKFEFRDTYPGAWMTMQFMAAYDPARNTGLYFALHDPLGNTKDMAVESKPADKAVVFRFDHPVPDMGKPANGFAAGGEAVWQLLRGDWFDAAVLYRNWVRSAAVWYPPVGPDGRADTPLEMRGLCAWVLGGGDPWDPKATLPEPRMVQTKEFARLCGPPVGLHWYNWHPNPFDNDYPHYLPAKKHFKEAVADLQSSGVLVMPYINGRLWDTRDRGLEDFEFGRIARPAAAKDERGEIVIEQYGSKESDGTPVRFAVMCPATKFWQDRVHDIVLRLYNEYGVKGVYIDQVAAAAARLCFDKTHGHPLGGGHWWADGYRQMLDRIRADMPKDRFLTTECNAEAYVRWFDGYLTWHWQYDGQVPAFPAVYGGALQMFGRSFGGGRAASGSRDLAMHMKLGQQLVFGEQIGWINPSVVGEKQNMEFLRQVVRLRGHLRRYFYAGEMARPPKVQGDLPTVRADWGWGGGNWWVQTEVLLTGAWRLPRQNRVALVFVNVSDKPVAAKLPLDATHYGLSAANVQVKVVGADGPIETFTEPSRFQRELALPPLAARAWELTPVP
jgi:hypothetical protein